MSETLGAVLHRVGQLFIRRFDQHSKDGSQLRRPRQDQRRTIHKRRRQAQEQPAPRTAQGPQSYSVEATLSVSSLGGSGACASNSAWPTWRLVSAMRIHVLGVGSIGSLLSYHLRRSAVIRQSHPLHNEPSIPRIVTQAIRESPPAASDYSVTLHLKSLRLAEHFDGLHVQRDGVTSRQDGFRIEVPGYGEVDLPDQSKADVARDVDAQRNEHAKASSSSRSPMVLGPTISSYFKGASSIPHGPSLIQRSENRDATTIDSLLVTTKADSTIEAMRPLVSRLTPESTVVLLQNGMGVVDEVIQQLFPSPSTRPHFIVGNLTHGVYASGAFKIVHAGFGSIRLGILPGEDSDAPPHEMFATSTNDIDASHRRLLSSLDLDASLPSTDRRTASLRATLLHILNLPLDVHWEPLAAYNVSALRKLVVNACINPTSAIFKVRNGELLDHGEALNMWESVCKEAAQVFGALRNGEGPTKSKGGPEPSQSTSSSPAPPLNWPLPPMRDSSPDVSTAPDLYNWRALLSNARSVAYATSKNYSSMYIDLHGRGENSQNIRASTEVGYLNGYISRLGRMYGVPTPVNDQLVSKIEELRQEAQGKRDMAVNKRQRKDSRREMREEQRRDQLRVRWS